MTQQVIMISELSDY